MIATVIYATALALAAANLGLTIRRRDRGEMAGALGLVFLAAWFVWLPLGFVGLFFITAGVLMQRRGATRERPE